MPFQPERVDHLSFPILEGIELVIGIFLSLQVSGLTWSLLRRRRRLDSAHVFENLISNLFSLIFTLLFNPFHHRVAFPVSASQSVATLFWHRSFPINSLP